jgi:hypothetical protein
MAWEIPKYEIDWSDGRVQAKDIPHDIVEQKFDLWDEFVESVIVSTKVPYQVGSCKRLRKESPESLARLFKDFLKTYVPQLDEEQKDLMEYLLEDYTIYAYAMLRWENKPIMLRYFQDALVNDTHKRIDAEASNQSGKSFSLCVKAAVAFHKNHGKNYTIGLISKSMPQNSMNMRNVTKMLQEAEYPYAAGSNDNMTVRVHNLKDGITNTLVCAVASTSALGYPFDLLLLDEFEFWENPEGLEYMYDQVLEPRTFQTKGQIIIYSNPNGKNFVSENLHKRKTNDDQYQFHVYNVNFLDVPGNTQEEWDTKQKYTHPIMFASTMAAKRTESEGAALTDTDIAKTKNDDVDSLGFRGCQGKPSYWFLDLGFVHDQSCLVGCWTSKNDKDETVYNFGVKVYPRSYEHEALWGRIEGTEESVPQLIKRHGDHLMQFELDLTGKEGNEILANQAGLSCAGVKMTGPWKATWYERFITLVKQGRVKVQQIDNWVDTQNKNFDFQARSLRISTKMADGRTRQYPLYHHEKESDHDDILDAIVGCISIVDEELTDIPGISYVPGTKEQEADEKRKKRNKVDDTPYDDEIELAVQEGYNANRFGGLY